VAEVVVAEVVVAEVVVAASRYFPTGYQQDHCTSNVRHLKPVAN
jgi:hypothetical protein